MPQAVRRRSRHQSLLGGLVATLRWAAAAAYTADASARGADALGNRGAINNTAVGADGLRVALATARLQ